MNYLFHHKDFLNDFLNINNTCLDALNIDDFYIDNNDDALIDFKNKLLEVKDKKILVVGDYDCDGICSTVIINRLLKHLGFTYNFYIPNRKDGYGLSDEIVDNAIKNNFDVIFTVDNGVSSLTSLKLCNDNNIKVFILDHHEYSEKPDCYAFLHPNLLKDSYNNLSAGGLAYLFSTLFYEDDISLICGGLSTYADMVGVLYFNRYLIKNAIKVLNDKKYYQFVLLNDNDNFDYDSLTFNLIPKINAVSRMDYNANILVKYFDADIDSAKKLANQIDQINNERKKLTSEYVKDIDSYIAYNKNFLVVICDQMKEGLCGLIANRLIYQYNKPVIVLTKTEGVLKGSGRAIDGFDIYSCLNKVSYLFTSFGGHEKACGLTIVDDKLKLLYDYLDNVNIDINDFCKDVIEVNINDFNIDLYNLIDSLKPFGTDLKEPLLSIDFINKERLTYLSNKYPKYFINSDICAICFDTNLDFNNFSKAIGYLRKDNYHKGKSSFFIEDLI